MASHSIGTSREWLPLSPELKDMSIPSHEISDSYISSRNTQDLNRLQSIARYESFHPQAMACSPPLQDATSTDEDSLYTAPGSERHARNYPVASAKPERWRRFASLSEPPQSLHQSTSTSLGAVAGSDGVALFRISKPHIPLMILSHAATNSSATGTLSTVSSLGFSNGSSRSSLYLASARGSGVLIWDVSGHSLSPLQGRLGIDHTSDNSAITSLSWTAIGSRIAATTTTSACLWDLRAANSFRPTLRFGFLNTTSEDSGHLLAYPPTYRQIACSDREEECAVLDSAGTVRIFDTRMTDRASRLHMGNLYQFDAFYHAGVGISYLPLKNRSEQCWVTWGLDSPIADAVVKVWLSTTSSALPLLDATSSIRDYWYMDTSPARPVSHKTSPSHSSDVTGYRLVGKCTSDNLACARVCPAPVEDSIVTVSLSQKGSDEGWKADLWKLNFNATNDAGNLQEIKLENVVSFQANNEVDAGLVAALGKDPQLSSLRASELAISFFNDVTADRSDYGLLLCCLTNNGFVMTHAIPEALLCNSRFQEEKKHEKFRTVATLSQPAIIYPTDSDSSVMDAAKLGKPMDSNSVFYRRDVAYGSTSSSVVAAPLFSDQSRMPFDMDSPLLYPSPHLGLIDLPSLGMVDLPSATILSAALSSDETDQTEKIANGLSSLAMERINTDRIPCPRMCGAVFSSGTGGLSAFHNGNVKRMWRWWVQKQQNRSSSQPSGIEGPPGVSNPVGIANFRGTIRDGNHFAVPSFTDYVRTLTDLLSMTSAAKATQWGCQSDAALTAFPLSGTHLFDYDSDGSSDSSENLDDCIADANNSKNLNGTYDGGHQRSFLDLSEKNHSLVDYERHDVELYGSVNLATISSAGILTPMVRVSHEYDLIKAHNQSRELALEWKLGGYTVDDGRDRHVKVTAKAPLQRSRRSGFDSSVSDTSFSPGCRVLPSYRSLLPHSRESRIEGSLLGTVVEDERGVHGGEYSVRPNMQESMVFLRKLFTHHHPDQGKESFPNLLSPPDSPMLPRSVKTRGPNDASDALLERNGVFERLQVGTYSGTDGNARHNEELNGMEDICLYNAKVCVLFGESAKMDTWKLVAKVIRTRMKRGGNDVSEWGGVGGGALGAVCIENILHYYELLGDVQMLANLVCVLRRKTFDRRSGRCVLLPPDQDARYDRYLRRYAELLYGWGLITLRADVIKHLSRPYAPVESRSSKFDDNLSVTLVFPCTRCGDISDIGYCRRCNEYAFHCTICDVAVRGLFTACTSCGHGGHFNHIMEWFALQSDECPTGCGCKCRFAATDKLVQEISCT